MNKKNNIEDAYPLSPMQQGMLFHSIYASKTGVYIGQADFELRGQLNVIALTKAWEQVIQRHSVLRTACIWENLQQPIQVVVRQVKIPWQELDWREIFPVQQQEKLKGLLEEDLYTDFNFSKAPLLRLMLIRLDETTYHFIWTYHLLLFDGWSLPLMYKEVFSYYKAFCRGQNLYLEKPRPYKDYISWLQQQDYHDSENFWRKTLKNFTNITSINTFLNNRNNLSDHKKQLSKNERNKAIQTINLSAITTSLLHSLAKKHQVTLNTIVQGAWVLLLSKYKGEEDIIFGTTVSGRPHTLTHANSMIGLFINTLPVRVKINNRQLLIAWLKQIQEQQIEARQYEYTPLVDIQRWSEIPGNVPLFESIVVFENYPEEKISLKESGLNLEIKICDRFERDNYPLGLTAIPGNELLLRIDYEKVKGFDDTTIYRMLGHLKTLLESMITHPQQSLSEFSLLTETEKQQLLVEWNNTEAEYPEDKCLHQLFEEQVEKTPDAVAVSFKSQQLTYKELNHRANQLAHYLQQQGVKPEVKVGIYLERSLEVSIAILGVLKAGGVYIPIDPNYPNKRVATILEDAQVELILSQFQLETELQTELSSNQTKCINLDRSSHVIAQHSTDNCLNQIDSENLAYVIYTSGSTGKPKGVAVSHKSLVNYTLEIAKQFELKMSDRVLQFASIGFDVVVEELFPTWISGGNVLFPGNSIPLSCREFQQLIELEQITVFNPPTAYWHQWISELLAAQQTVPSCVRLVIVGGERISPERLRQWQSFSIPLVHGYGLTETTVTSTLYQLNTDTKLLETGKELPIGKPIANTQIYLLNSLLQPVPVGVAGEIYIGGEGIARGYLNRPELTAEKFIPNPFDNHLASRLYKTGDLARYSENGEIEYIGRIDYQVKLRGFRIELREIEAVLNQHLAVAEGLVLLREDIPGNPGLVAYVTLQPKQTITISELRRELESKLPNYMMPSAFVILEALPLTPNGKIDRKALPAPDFSQLIAETECLAPSTPTQKILAGIWHEILGVERVGVSDNFFELGGHSLLLTQLISKLRQIFQIELPLRILYESPTVASLAEKIESIFQNGLSNAFKEETLIDLSAEANLDSNIFLKAQIIKFNSEPSSIFLTGATGFLGAFLLYELLQQTQADIYCLVRAKDLEQGKQKLQDVLESYLIWDESFSQRIIPVVGDLAKPLLGFSKEQFQELANQLDVIYHNGAWVHHLYPYSVLKAANVSGTQEVIRLACTNKAKPIHYISTLDVFSSTGYSGVRLVKEQDSIECEKVPSDGYIQTKWVAEKLIKTAEARGLPICIYRPGRISGHSQTGVFNSNDFLHKLTIGCIELGSAPEENSIQCILPVDYVSQAIVYLSRQERSVGKAFHLLNFQYDYIDKLIQVAHSFGFSIQQISYEQWQHKLMNIANNSPKHPLYSLMPFFPAQGFDSEVIEQEAELKFDCQNTVKGLSNTAIRCPKIDEKIISNYFKCAKQKGLFNN